MKDKVDNLLIALSNNPAGNLVRRINTHHRKVKNQIGHHFGSRFQQHKEEFKVKDNFCPKRLEEEILVEFPTSRQDPYYSSDDDEEGDEEGIVTGNILDELEAQVLKDTKSYKSSPALPISDEDDNDDTAPTSPDQGSEEETSEEDLLSTMEEVELSDDSFSQPPRRLSFLTGFNNSRRARKKSITKSPPSSTTNCSDPESPRSVVARQNSTDSSGSACYQNKMSNLTKAFASSLRKLMEPDDNHVVSAKSRGRRTRQRSNPRETVNLINEAQGGEAQQ